MGIYVIVNIILYLLLFFWYRSKNGTIFSPGGILISQYLLVAVCCYFVFNLTQSGDFVFVQEKWILTFWPFPYLFFCFILLSRYFIFNKPKEFRDNPRLIRIITWSFIFSASMYVLVLFPRLLDNLLSGDWATIYTMAHVEDKKDYSNLFERLIMIFCMYFKIPAMVIMFHNISLKLKNKTNYLLIITLLLYIFSSAILSASRAHMYIGIVEIVVMYIYFYDKIDIRLRRKITTVSLGVLVLCMFIIIAITISREGNRGGQELVLQNFLYYFGHSMLKFNYGVVDTIKEFANGDFFCRSIVGYIPGDAELGTHSDPLFTTLIGALYKDFGPIGTIMVSIFAPFLISRSWLSRKSQYMDLAEITIYFYFFNELLVGVFYENCSILNWFIYLIIYIGLKLLKRII